MSIIPKIADGPEQRAQIVSQVFGGIQSPFEAFYIHSILYSADCSLRAFKRYDELKSRRGDPSHLIGAVQEAIGHAGALSRYFWPPKPRDKERNRPRFHQVVKDRGEKLRNAFEVTESSPLYDRNLRNVWEHFDEKLDEYLLEVVAGMFFPQCVVGRIDEPPKLTDHYFKMLDPEAECLILLDTRYYFGLIRAEVSRIYDSAMNAENDGCRLPLRDLEANA